MKKTFQIYGILFLIILLILGILEVNKKPIIDWGKTFDVNEKAPFGLYVFNKEADVLFNNQLTRIQESPYSYYSKEKTNAVHNILVIDKRLDASSVDKLLEQAQKGSDVFIIGQRFDDHLQDTLKIRSNTVYNQKSTLHFTDKRFTKDSLLIDKLPTDNGITLLSKEHRILGSSSDGDSPYANFVKVNYGKGHIYLHTEPLILTNYYLLKPSGQAYVQDVFSYLPKRQTLWFMEEDDKGKSSSLMRFILSNEALRNAWWLFLGCLVLFAFFNAKRKQRVVPIIEPLENKSVEFVKSIGNLYLQEGSLGDMIAKKAQYFLHRLRADLLLDTHDLDASFAHKLHLKTGKDLNKINEALALIKKAQQPTANVTKEDLMKMNTLLDDILNQ